VRLRVIGCSGSLPGPDSAASCYLVEAGDTTLVLDLGNGALGPLQRWARLDRIDGVLLSHLHADHCLDLCGYYVASRYAPRDDYPQVPVWGPAGTAARMARAYGLPEDPGMTQEFDFRTYPSAPFMVGEVRVSVTSVVHPVPAYAIRLEHGGSSLTYSGDTAATPALVDLAWEADLFVCGASCVDGEPNPPGLHLTGREAGEHAAAAGVSRLLLTHIPPWTDPAVPAAEARAVFDGPTEVAVAGAVTDL